MILGSQWLAEDKQQRLLEIESAVPFCFFLHAAEDESRTEEATEHKKRKAREEEGRVFLTQELPQAAVLIVAVSVLLILSAFYHELLKEMMIKYLENPQRFVFSAENINVLIKDFVYSMLVFILPVGGAAMSTAVLTSLVQTNFHFSWVPLKVNFKRITPTWENFKNKTFFARAQLINTVKIFFKIVVIMTMAYFFLRFNYAKIIMLTHGSLLNSYAEMGWMVYFLVLFVSLTFLLMAIPDWYIQRFEYEESLKMTKEEIRQEHKELEGDPMVRSRIRERARELIGRDVIGKVKEADVLVTNPTHFSCAIQYEPAKMDAPKLLSKGQDRVALKMRETAQENGIPIVENKPLARSLYANVEIDQYVPIEYYSAIAEILAALDKFKSTS